MSCPHPLQAHQIQGNDYVACFPVVQWLVKTVLEYRAITGDYVRTASQSAFYRTFSPWLTREDAASAQASSRLLTAGADRTLTSATMPQEKVRSPHSPSCCHRTCGGLHAFVKEHRVHAHIECTLPAHEQTLCMRTHARVHTLIVSDPAAGGSCDRPLPSGAQVSPPSRSVDAAHDVRAARTIRAAGVW